MVKDLTAKRIVIFYSIFAVLAGCLNLAVQMISVAVYKGPYFVECSILLGTCVSMPARYWLEKNYIFFFLSKNLKHDIRMFLVYGAMSVVTTIIFWSVEYLFHLIFDADLMRYIGAILGLSLGYYLKYQLDKMFVFSNRCIRIKGL